MHTWCGVNLKQAQFTVKEVCVRWHCLLCKKLMPQLGYSKDELLTRGQRTWRELWAVMLLSNL